MHFRLNLPIDDERPDGPKASKRISTTGCHRRAKFVVPLLPDAYLDDQPLDIEQFDFDDEKHPTKLMSDGVPSLVHVCAVDDSMGLWPRFQDAMHTGQSFEPTE